MKPSINSTGPGEKTASKESDRQQRVTFVRGCRACQGPSQAKHTAMDDLRTMAVCLSFIVRVKPRKKERKKEPQKEIKTEKKPKQCNTSSVETSERQLLSKIQITKVREGLNTTLTVLIDANLFKFIH